MGRTIRVGIDIGGTFTDFIAVDDESREIYTAKILTTPSDPTVAVLRGIETLLNAHEIDPGSVGSLIHATTLITNTLIERKGARVALLTTKGFPDLIEIGREVRYDLYDIFLKMPPPLVPRELRFEIPERTLHTGEVLVKPDEQTTLTIASKLRDRKVESIAICLLHSYVNPDNEQRVANLLRDAVPEIPVSSSAEVAGEIREYERFSTTAANAYVKPIASRYLEDMGAKLAGAGIDAPLQIMLSNGGTTSTEEASRLPVRLIESGPAAGALIAAHYARQLGEPLVLAFDMGGTTAKLCAIDDGSPAIGSGLEVSRIHRFKRGSGLPIRAPSVELIEIGAGGGSIARIDELGLLSVGPDSAGADPGPACYGLGGSLPTVTDADLLLGYLNPDYFLGGKMQLFHQASRAAIDDHLVSRLGMDTVSVAAGICDVVNENMATAAGVYIAERGQDPRQFVMVATGGAGPVHAIEVAQKLGISKVIVPPSAGVASAGGLLVAPPRMDFARSLLTTSEDLDWRVVDILFAEMEAEATETLRRIGIPATDTTIERSVDARYVNQGHEFPVPLPACITVDNAGELLRNAFEAVYERLFGRTVPGVPIECVTWRTTVRGPDGDLPQPAIPASSKTVPNHYRPVHFRSAATAVQTPVYLRGDLAPGTTIAGPAIVEEAQSTLVVGPVDRFSCISGGIIIVDLNKGEIS